MDIGSRYLKMIQLSATSNGIQVSNFAFAATPIGAVTEGTINNPEAVGEALRQMLKYFNMKEKRIMCSLPGRAVSIRQVNTPANLPDKEVKGYVISEVERFLPYPLDEMEYSYHDLGAITAGDAKQNSVLFIASHKDAITRRLESVRFAGLESIEVDIDPFVILRAVLESGLFDTPEIIEETLLLIDMGASATNVSIIHGGMLRFTRIFAIGGDTLTHAIESGFDIQYLEAEKLKMEKAVAIIDDDTMDVDSETREIHDMIKQHLDSLALEIRRSVAYYMSKYRGESISRIILTGGASLLRGMARFFEDDQNKPVLYSHPLKNLSYIGDGDMSRLERFAPYMGIAVGMALRHVSPRVLNKFTLKIGIEPGYEFGSAAQSGGGMG